MIHTVCGSYRSDWPSFLSGGFWPCSPPPAITVDGPAMAWERLTDLAADEGHIPSELAAMQSALARGMTSLGVPNSHN